MPIFRAESRMLFKVCSAAFFSPGAQRSLAWSTCRCSAAIAALNAPSQSPSVACANSNSWSMFFLLSAASTFLSKLPSVKAMISVMPLSAAARYMANSFGISSLAVDAAAIRSSLVTASLASAFHPCCFATLTSATTAAGSGALDLSTSSHSACSFLTFNISFASVAFLNSGRSMRPCCCAARMAVCRAISRCASSLNLAPGSAALVSCTLQSKFINASL
mmetsp:Transcript_39330/g.101751  ORF Transcript_39330/g.101751 Transcript_39330/m.101751 type:complete len:220 (-) Transcript_39330:563-1222(-)